MKRTTTHVVKSVELPNRAKLQYVEQGDPSGIPMVLLHGVTDSWRSFEPVLPHLPQSIHAFALSQRGHGDEPRPAAGYQLDDFAGDVAAFMDALDIGQAVVVGHSMGSSVAQRFALDYPERTLGVGLVGSVTTWRGNPGLVELWDSAVSTLTDPIDPGIVREFQESTLARPVPQAFFETVVRESLKVPARVWRSALEGMLEPDFSGELDKISAPTLIVWGDQDELALRSEQEALVATIVGSRLVLYPGAGHALHWEEPDSVADDLASFAEKVAG